MSGPTPRRLWNFAMRRLRLRDYFADPGDGRRQPQIPGQTLLWALLIGQILRQSSFHAVEALVRSSARRTLSIATPFCDDTLGYFTERLDPGPTRQALLSLIRGAKRNKAFDDCRWIGLAIRHRCGMADPAGLQLLSAAAQRGGTDPRLSTFFRDGQRGGNRPVSTLRWRTLRTER